MEKILFRAQEAETKKWVYGDLITDGKNSPNKDLYWIFPEDAYQYSFDLLVRVIPETIGQLVEDNPILGKRFSGDIIELFRREDNTRSRPIISSIKYFHGCFMANNTTWYDLYRVYKSDFKVIGNMHDNPYLLQKLWNASK